jgi:phosphoserine phosphatase
MDGTLLPSTTACVELAKITNTLAALQELEQHLRVGKIDTKAFAIGIYRLWGKLEPELIMNAFNDCPKLDNIKSVIHDIAETGGRTCLITMAPDYFAQHFSEYGFNYIFASRFPTDSRSDLDLNAILTPADKPRIVRQVCDIEKLPFDQAVAFGDSISDMDLFQRLKYTVSVNGGMEIEQAALIRYRGMDLWPAYFQLLETIQDID